jgi:Domain of unknown function (DUF4412)
MRIAPLLGLVMLGVAGVAPSLRAQKLFEGTITYEVTPNGGTPLELIVRSNGHKLRQDMRTPGTGDESTTYQIIDGESGDVMVVIPAARQYMVANMKKARAAAGDGGDSSRARADQLLADVVSTGRKETIVGLTCEVYVRKSQPGDEWCLTNSLGKVAAIDDRFTGSSAMTNAMRPFRDGALVLRATMGASAGRPMTMVATRVDRTLPPASLFKPPAGFDEMKNPMAPRQ